MFPESKLCSLVPSSSPEPWSAALKTASFISTMCAMRLVTECITDAQQMFCTELILTEQKNTKSICPIQESLPLSTEPGKKNTGGLQSKLNLKPLISKKASMKVFKVLNWVDRAVTEKRMRIYCLSYRTKPQNPNCEKDIKRL